MEKVSHIIFWVFGSWIKFEQKNWKSTPYYFLRIRFISKRVWATLSRKMEKVPLFYFLRIWFKNMQNFCIFNFRLLMETHGDDHQERVILIWVQHLIEILGHRKGKFLCHIWLEDLWMNLKVGNFLPNRLVIFHAMKVRLNPKFQAFTYNNIIDSDHQ